MTQLLTVNHEKPQMDEDYHTRLVTSTKTLTLWFPRWESSRRLDRETTSSVSVKIIKIRHTAQLKSQYLRFGCRVTGSLKYEKQDENTMIISGYDN